MIMRDLSKAIAIITDDRCEGKAFAPKAYLCPSKLWTIGWGHTKGVKQGDTCDEAQGKRWLADDMRWAVEAINRRVHVPLNDDQFQALVSFVFNTGEPEFATSTLLRLLNAGEYDVAADQFKRWIHNAAGEEMGGLVYRRGLERALFIEPQ